MTARQIEQRGDVSDRCETNRNIKERNSLRRNLKETFDEITAFIIRKARKIYGRYTELRRHTADTQKAGRDDKDVRRTAGRGRQAGTADFGTDAGAFTDKGTTGRILGIKRGLDERKQAIDRADYIIKRTESEIADTDRHLEELSKQIKDKENDHDERICKLKERRRAYQNAGGNAGRTGQQRQDDRELRETASDISAFLRSIELKEQDSEAKRNDSLAKRSDRDDERERQRIQAEQMYSYAQDLQDNQEAYINEMASNMISDEKAALQASYEQKNKALINSAKSEKQKLEKQYQKLSTDLHTKYKKLSLTNEGIMINICICMAILCIISLSMNAHFIEAYKDIFNGFQDFGDDYENLTGSIMFVIWLLFLIFWSIRKFGDRYTIYVITTLLSVMIFTSGFCYEHNINFIGIGNLLYFIYGVARSIHAIEDYEQRKQAATFVILMVVSIATVIFLFKALAASFADLTG